MSLKYREWKNCFGPSLQSQSYYLESIKVICSECKIHLQSDEQYRIVIVPPNECRCPCSEHETNLEPIL